MPNAKPSLLVDRVLSWSFEHPLAGPGRYAVTTFLIVAVGVFRSLIVTSAVPWLLFFPPILLTGLMFGRAPGIYAAAASAVVAGLSIGTASEPLWLTQAQWVGSALFLVISSGLALLAAELRSVIAQTRRIAAEKDNLLIQLAEGEEQLRLLNGELAHRLKNTLGVVQAIATQTLGRGDKEALSIFSKRLSALSAAHDVLLQTNWSGASFPTVAASALETFNGRNQISLNGPDLEIGSRAAQSLCLLLHELATNAVKHGALSVPDGTIRVAWAVHHQEPVAQLVLHWIERGGPPAREPERQGFGSRIIRMGLTGSGGAELKYEDAGVSAAFSAPLDQLQEA